MVVVFGQGVVRRGEHDAEENNAVRDLRDS